MLPPSVAKWQNSLSLQACPGLLSTRSVLGARILYLLWPLCCQSKMSLWIQAERRICLLQHKFIKNLPRKQAEQTTLQRFCTSTDNVILGWLSDIQAKIPGDDVVEWEYTLRGLKEAWWVRVFKTQVKDKHYHRVFYLERKLCSTTSLFILALVPQKMDFASFVTFCGVTDQLRYPVHR